MIISIGFNSLIVIVYVPI